jgi:ribosome-binding protein aMBF1 (putative translation factor)
MDKDNGSRLSGVEVGPMDIQPAGGPMDNETLHPAVEPREPHRYLAPSIADSLTQARHMRGWSYRKAAQVTGVDAGYLCHLEHGRRVPSVVVVEELVKGYGLTGSDAENLRAVGLAGVGRDGHEAQR